tara:strand:+ start:41 stop:478 length:438 start_codon:yes stop_codon:yes gene_type:complete
MQPIDAAWNLLKAIRMDDEYADEPIDYGDANWPDGPGHFMFTGGKGSMNPFSVSSRQKIGDETPAHAQVTAQRPAHLDNAEEARLAALSEAQGTVSPEMHMTQLLGELTARLDNTIPGTLERMQLEERIQELQNRVSRMGPGSSP